MSRNPKLRDSFSIRIKKRLTRIPKKLYRLLTNQTDYKLSKLFYHAIRKFTRPKIEVVLTNHGAYRYRERFDEWKTSASKVQKDCIKHITKLLKRKQIVFDCNMKWINTSSPEEVFVFDIDYDYVKHTKIFKLVTCYKKNVLT